MGSPYETVDGVIEVQMKCFFFLLLNSNSKSSKNQEDHHLQFLNIKSLPVRSYKGIKMSSFGSKSAQKDCLNQSKSVKFLTSYAGHVDGMKKIKG